MSLNKNIRKSLIEAKETKKRVVQESKIVDLRFKIILESAELKTDKGLDELMVNVLTEMIFLYKQGFEPKIISESVASVFNIIGNIFGGTTNSVIELFRDRGVKYILEQLGIDDNFALKSYMMTALENTDIHDVPKLFSDCEFLTKKISMSIPESYLKQLESEQGMGIEFLDVVRGTLQDVIRESNFSEKLEGRISRIVCPIVEKMSQRFGDRLNTMKSTLISGGMNIQPE